jgi:hypothetical protein
MRDPALSRAPSQTNIHLLLAAFKTPIKHIYRKNQCIFEAGFANQLILLIPKFSDANEARKTWCGKYLV